MGCLRKFLSTGSIVAATVVTALLVTCYGPREVTARKKQEAEFRGFFGIVPTAAVTEIRYHENGGFFGGSTCWMSFTCDPTTYDTVLIANAYKPSKESMIGWGRTNAPAWWPKADPPQSLLYSRSQDDTPPDEGFQFLEFMWRDPASGIVYFTKSYWD